MKTDLENISMNALAGQVDCWGIMLIFEFLVQSQIEPPEKKQLEFCKKGHVLSQNFIYVKTTQEILNASNFVKQFKN